MKLQEQELPSHLEATYKELEKRTGHKFLKQNTIMLVRVGSSLYGVEGDKSDVDYLGVVMESEEVLYSMTRFQRAELIGYEYGELKVDLKLISLLEFFKHFKKGDFNIIQLLFSTKESQVITTELALELAEELKQKINKYGVSRHESMAKSEHKNYLTKEESQKKKEKRRYMAINCMEQALELLTTGEVQLYREERAKELVYLRSTECTTEFYEKRYEELEKQVEEAKKTTALQEAVTEEELSPILVKYTKLYLK